MDSDAVGAVIVEAICRARPALADKSQHEILALRVSELALDSLDSTTLSLDIEDFCGVIIEPVDFQECESVVDLQTLVFSKIQ